MMRKWLFICCVFFILPAVNTVKAQSNEVANDLIAFQITPSFSPEDLSLLIQKLAKRGILLRFEETGYCNGQLRVVKGEIIGSDGSRFGFETQALKRMHFEMVARAKTLGINTVKIKKHWKKCRPVETEEVEDVPDDFQSRPAPIQQI